MTKENRNATAISFVKRFILIPFFVEQSIFCKIKISTRLPHVNQKALHQKALLELNFQNYGCFIIIKKNLKILFLDFNKMFLKPYNPVINSFL